MITHALSSADSVLLFRGLFVCALLGPAIWNMSLMFIYLVTNYHALTAYTKCSVFVRVLFLSTYAMKPKTE